MISLTDLELFLQIAREKDSELLTVLEAAADAFFAGETNRFFGAEEEAIEFVIGGNHRDLWLRDLAATVTSVTEQTWPGATPTTITAGDDDGFEIRGYTLSKLVRKGGHAWQSGYEYTVTYQRGFNEVEAGPPADIEAPVDVRLAVQLIVAALYNDGKPSDGARALMAEKMGNYSYTKSMLGDQLYSMVPALKNTVMRWKRKLV